MRDSIRQFCTVFILISLSFIGSCQAKRAEVPATKLHTSHPVLTEEEQNKFQNYFLEAQRLKYLDKADAAFDLFQKCAEIDTASAAVCYELADYYLKMNDAASAYHCIRKATRLDPENYWYLYSLANLAQGLNQPDEAIRALSKLSVKYPDKSELNYALAEIYSQKKDYKKAIATLDKLEEQLGLTEEISIEKYRLYFVVNDPKKAFLEILKLVQAFPKDVRYRIILGNMYLENNRLVEALSHYDIAKSIEPSNGFLAVSMANYYEKTGDKAKSDEQIRSALMNPKTEVETKHRILNSYLTTRLEKPEERENIQSLFNALIEMHPQEDSFYQLFASYLATQKKLPEAREKLLFAVGLSPTNVELWRQLLNVNLGLTDYPAVIDVCKKAIGYFPDAAEFYFYKGMGLFLSDSLTQAIDSYQAGLKVADEKNVTLISDFYAQIGDVYQKMENLKLAFEAYDNALKYNENNFVVLNNYAYFLSIHKRDLRKAEQMSGKCIAAEPNNPTYLDTYAWIYFVQKNFTLAKFYIEKALKNGGDKSEVVVEHYGDILVMSGDVEKALQLWKTSLSMGNTSETLSKKIESSTYIEEPLK